MSIGTLGLQDIVLDISTKLKQKTFRANESDTNARGLSATIKNNGAIYDCTGVTLRFRYVDPITLQAHIFDFEPISAPLGTFKMAFPSEMIRGNGGKTIKCTIVAEDSTSELTFENIYVYVNMSEVDSNGIEASNEYSTLRKALDDVQAVETGLGNINPTTLANAVTLANTISVAESDRDTNEGTRNINENTRTTNEVAREVAEANRNVYEAYNVSKAYKLNNKVTYLGSSYLCIQATTGGIAPTDVAYWLKIVSKGDQGVQGVQGIKGDKGDTGAKGDTGSQGIQGIKGDTGDKGEKGDTGLKGDRGETFTYTHMSVNDKQDLVSNATEQWNPDFETRYTALETEYATDLTGVKSQLAEKAQKGTVDQLTGQLENLVLESGTSDTEVVAMRTDKDGYSFPTIGSRATNMEKKLADGAFDIPITWEVGGIGTSTGVDNVNANSLRTKGFIPFIVGESIRLKVLPVYKIIFIYYNADKVFQTISPLWYSTDTVLQINYPYFRMMLQKVVAGASVLTWENDVSFNIDYAIGENAIGYDAIKSQKLKSIVTNLFNSFDFTWGYYDSTGTLVSNTGAGRTEFVEVPKGVKYVSTNYATTQFCLVAFDANFNYLYNNSGDYKSNGYNTMKILDTVKYVVCQFFTFMHTNIHDWVFIWGNTVPNIATTTYEYAKGNQPEKLIVGRANGNNEILANLDNPLYHKTVIWDGDSIMNGSAAQDTSGLKGWTGRIAKNNYQIYKNYSVGGATISALVPDRHWVCRYVDTMFAEYPNADYILFDGGTNDADNLVPMGAMSVGYSAALDDTTFIGAMESLCKQLITKYPTKKIGYIIPHKMGDTDAVRNARRTYFEQAISVCKKWGIPYTDLWFDCHICYNVTPSLMFDTQHLNTAGYDLTSPKVERWMKKL